MKNYRWEERTKITSSFKQGTYIHKRISQMRNRRPRERQYTPISQVIHLVLLIRLFDTSLSAPHSVFVIRTFSNLITYISRSFYYLICLDAVCYHLFFFNTALTLSCCCTVSENFLILHIVIIFNSVISMSDGVWVPVQNFSGLLPRTRVILLQIAPFL